jgi:hypothetical protein
LVEVLEVLLFISEILVCIGATSVVEGNRICCGGVDPIGVAGFEVGGKDGI